jgi:hypothetical protein
MGRMPQTIAAVRQVRRALTWPPPRRATKRRVREAVFQRLVAFHIHKEPAEAAAFRVVAHPAGLFAPAGDPETVERAVNSDIPFTRENSAHRVDITGPKLLCERRKYATTSHGHDAAPARRCP